MAQYLIKDSSLSNIGNAIRYMTGYTTKIPPENMASQISSIPGHKVYLCGTYKLKNDLSFLDSTISSTIGAYLDDDNISPEARMYYTTNELGGFERAYLEDMYFTSEYVQFCSEDDIYIRNTYSNGWQCLDYSSPGGEEYSLLDNSHLIIEIYRPKLVSQEFYDLFMQIVDDNNLHTAIQQPGITTSFPSYYYDNVSQIRSHAFCNNRTGISEMHFPNVKTVGFEAFRNQSNLKRITLNFVETIESNAFYGCVQLSSVSFGNAITTLGISAFVNCPISGTISIPTCQYIENNCFYCNSKLSSVVLNNCKTIGGSAFYSCSQLMTISSASNCTGIYDSAFFSCPKITSISFPACQTISSYAFAKCTSISTAYIPKCKSIGNYAFSGCTSLTTVNISGAETEIGAYAFYNCSKLTNISFSACQGIGSYAFKNCTSLSRVSGIIAGRVDNYAFDGCKSLWYISFGAVSWFGSYAFRSALSSIAYTTGGMEQTLKISMYGPQTIGLGAFAYCSSIISAWIGGTSQTTISASAFYSTPLTTLKIYCNSVATLQNSNALSGTRLSVWYQQTGATSIKYTGSIYVPASLVAAYKTATNWVYWSSYIYSM